MDGLIHKGTFSDVYVAKNSNGTACFVKIFKKPKNYLFNGYDLKPLYQRNRPTVSLWGYNLMAQSPILAKHLPLQAFAIDNLNLFITTSKHSNAKSLSVLIKNKKSDLWINQIVNLTLDFRKTNLRFSDNFPKYLNNKPVWQLKKRLQLIKPLSFLMKETKIRKLIASLGSVGYFAHGDLQPKNIILDNGEIEIIGFEESFVAPKDWDTGFLWGNILYLSASNPSLFKKVVTIWGNLSVKHNNFSIISIAVCAMRIFMFPLSKLSIYAKDRLVKFCLSQVNKL